MVGQFNGCCHLLCNFKARTFASDRPVSVTNVRGFIQKLTLSYMLNSTNLQLYLDVLHRLSILWATFHITGTHSPSNEGFG